MASYIELSADFRDLYLSYEHHFIVAVIGRCIAFLSNAAACLSCGAHDLACNCKLGRWIVRGV
jgi:hypothetical protein